MLSKQCLLLFALVLEYSLITVVLVDAQDDNPPGFVSIDCGFQGPDYKESTSGTFYKSDANLIDSGVSSSISPDFITNSIEKYFYNVRSFPQGEKNCYTIQISGGKGNKYLIRASFMYGNYDSLSQFPTFDLNLGASNWSTIIITDSLIPVRPEILHVLSSDYIHVCLVKTGNTIPFISALELRPLTDSMYTTDSGSSLQTFDRINCGPKETDAVIRYEDDKYDRRWNPKNWSDTGISTPSFDIDNKNDFLVPISVLRTACTPDRNTDSLEFFWESTKATDEFYIFMHFTEVVNIGAGLSRKFNIYMNNDVWYNITAEYLRVNSFESPNLVTGSKKYTITLTKPQSSLYAPIINAYEIYTSKKISNSGTYDIDVSAILNIKSTYKVKRDWQGDPCEPEDFVWEGLECSYPSSNHSARITSLNLSTSGLTGVVVNSIANLTQLKTLDLSNNNLKGQVPEFLSRLPLSVLNLKGNKFTGPVPAKLLENQNKGILSLSYDVPGDEKKNKSTPAVVGSALGSVLFLAAILFGIWIFRQRILQGKRSGIEKIKKKYTYREILHITSNLDTELGEGGFGKVYLGHIKNIQVAVKMLSETADQGLTEFETEPKLLMSISHKNIISLVGYCHEGGKMGIIYEYMAMDNLDKHLTASSPGISSWEIRLQIALNVAEGLEYLHHGCRRAIIHRDVKTSNILLNAQFEAVLGDFGLSKACPANGGLAVVTSFVAGTLGYIDPEYSESENLTVKSDVYSFGVVLLQIITGKPTIIPLPDNSSGTSTDVSIADWVYLKNNAREQVLDQNIRKKHHIQTEQEAVNLALICTSDKSSDRPSMSEVVRVLRVCLEKENSSPDVNSNSTTGVVDADVRNSLV